MYSFMPLEIAGYRREPVPNTFFRQKEKARQVAIVLPGVGYTCQMPVLYYPTRLLLSLGLDVLWVEYNYSRRPEYSTRSDAERQAWLFADATGAYQAVLAQGDYERIVLIGKSLGTLAMSRLFENEARLSRSQAIWLTPLLKSDPVRAQISSGPRGLVVIGTADSHYDPTYLIELESKRNCEIVIVEGADHSLEINGDVWQSLQVIERMTRAIQTFVSKA